MKDPAGNGMQNVLMTLSGSESNSCYTDSNGHYSFLITTMSYVITPSSFSYYSFTPSSITYTNIQIEQDNQNFTRVDNAPVLSWSGEVGYETDGVSPDIGTSTTPFTFHIKYTDSDNDPPASGYPRVIISTGGVVINTIPMGYVSGAYNTGAIYSTSTLLNICTYYKYTFQANDIYNSSANDLSKSGQILKTYVTGYIKDPAGNGMQNVLMTLSGSESNSCYTNIYGSWFFLITTMSYTVTPSSFSYYYFSPSSITYTNIQIEQDNQNFMRVDNAPVLSWAGTSGYETGGIEPNISTFTATLYKVKYINADNDQPATGYPKVIISSGGVVLKTISMNYKSGNYTSGAIFSTSTLLAPCSYYNYTFSANDCWGNCSTSTLSGSGPASLVSLMGYCYYPSGSPMPNVLLTLTDNVGDTFTSISSSFGSYMFTGLVPNLNYTITPSSFSYYSFTPKTNNYNNLQSNLINQNFTRNNSTNTASLNWTGETGYVTSGIQPTLHYTTTIFNYRINSTDLGK